VRRWSIVTNEGLVRVQGWVRVGGFGGKSMPMGLKGVDGGGSQTGGGDGR
jgi:hypothetical protein